MLRLFLLHRHMILALAVINGLGTIYGYYWYKDQLVDTHENFSHWLLPFVPDSPTASLFFTLALLSLLLRVRTAAGLHLAGFIEAFAVITSFKYGIWAVAVILAGFAQGDAAEWEEWMLIASHLGMALEAVLYSFFFRYRPVHVLIVAVWSLANDLIDYGAGVHPWLPDELEDDLGVIAAVTLALGLLGTGWAFAAAKFRRKKQV